MRSKLPRSWTIPMWFGVDPWLPGNNGRVPRLMIEVDACSCLWLLSHSEKSLNFSKLERIFKQHAAVAVKRMWKNFSTWNLPVSWTNSFVFFFARLYETFKDAQKVAIWWIWSMPSTESMSFNYPYWRKQPCKSKRSFWVIKMHQNASRFI